jgi:hypothetical protein
MTVLFFPSSPSVGHVRGGRNLEKSYAFNKLLATLIKYIKDYKITLLEQGKTDYLPRKLPGNKKYGLRSCDRLFSLALYLI